MICIQEYLHQKISVLQEKVMLCMLSQWGWSDSGKLSVNSLSADKTDKISKVSMLGAGELAFEQNSESLTVTLPKEKPCKFAYVLKVEF